MTRLTPLAVLAVSLVTAGCSHDPAQAAAGKWKSPLAEDMGNGSFATRDFQITSTRWSLLFTIYGDKELAYPLLAFRAEGPWSVGADSTVVAGANEAMFDFATKKLTLISADPAVASGFGVGGCGLEVGLEKDISQSGCSFFLSVAQYPREYDLVKVDADTLYLGARPADNDLGSEAKRPKALGAPLKKAK
jgi:hypothetical protein